MPRIFHKDHVIAYYDDLPLAMGRNCHDILIVDDAVKSMLRFSMAMTLLSAIHGVKVFDDGRKAPSVISFRLA